MDPLNTKNAHRIAGIIGFVTTPLILGTALMVTMASDILIIKEPEKIERLPPQNASLHLGRIHVAILSARKGTQATELLVSFAAFSQVKKYYPYVVGEARVPSALTGSVAVVPEYSFEKAPAPNIIVIPSIANWNAPQVQAWLKKHLPNAERVISLSEGARALALAGFLNDRQLTTHPSAAEDIRTLASGVQLDLEQRVLRSKNLISTRAPGAAAEAMQVFFKDAGNRLPRWKIGQRQTPRSLSPVSSNDLLFMFASGGFIWNRKGVGVLVYPGVDEIDLAAALDTFNHTWNIRMVTFSRSRAAFKTRLGLDLIPTLQAQDTPLFDALIVPSGDFRPDQWQHAGLQLSDQQNNLKSPLDDVAVQALIKRNGSDMKLVNLYNPTPRSVPTPDPFVRMYQTIEDLSSFAHAQFAARWIDYPRSLGPWGDNLTAQLPKMIWLRMLGLALMGMTLCSFISKKIGRARATGLDGSN